MTRIICEWEIDAILGEGPLWVERESALYWVDIVGKKLHRFSPGDGDRRTCSFAAGLTSLAVRRQGGFVGTIRDGFAFIDPENGEVEPIVMPAEIGPGNRFNDGKVDGLGRYWAGTMDEAQASASGVLYCLDKNLTLHTMDDDYTITNGPAFSVDNTTLYHTDSSRRTIYAFDLSQTGAISNKRIFVQLQDEAEGFPDGMTVDSEDCLWLCHFAGARITRYSPAGKVLQVIPMPVPNVTSCTFGGPKLDTLYITTARLPMRVAENSRIPLAGSLFSCKPGISGLPTPMFAG